MGKLTNNLKKMEMEKFSKEFCKYDVLMGSPPFIKTQDLKKAEKEAYTMLAKDLGLSDVKTVKLLIRKMKHLALRKLRLYVHRSILRGYSAQDGLRCAPEYLRRLEKPFNLMEKALKIESVVNPKGRSITAHFTSKLLQCVQNTLSRATHPPSVLTTPDAVKDLAETMDLDVGKLHGIWMRLYNQSLHKLRALIDAGDCEHATPQCARLSSDGWRAAEVGALHDPRVQIVSDKYLKSSLTLYPLTRLFELIVSAKEILQRYSHSLLQNVGAKIVQSDRPDSKRSEAIKSERRSMVDDEESKNLFCFEPPELWALVYSKYLVGGGRLSPVLLQKRWHELRLAARSRAAAGAGAGAAGDLLDAVCTQFPYITTESMPSWKDLVASGHIYNEIDLLTYRQKIIDIELSIPPYLNPDAVAITQESIQQEPETTHNENVVQIIKNIDDIITLSDSYSDEEQTLPNTIQKPQNILKKLDCLETLARIDPETAKVTVIIESDDDDEVFYENNDLKINENSHPNDSKISSGNELSDCQNDDRIKDEYRDSENFGLDFEESNNYNVKNRDIDMEIEPKLEISIDNGYIFCNDDEINSDESSNTSGDEAMNDEDDNSETIDEKLLKTTHVVLTPIEELYEWKRYAKDTVLNCRRFSVRKFSKSVHISDEQLKNCRPYIDKTSTGISRRKCQEFAGLSREIAKKRIYLTKHLTLSRTEFAKGFWNGNNIELLEMCKPVSVHVERVSRVVKKVKLIDIDEVRRVNSTLLVAQVAPITVGPNHTIIINPTSTNIYKPTDFMSEIDDPLVKLFSHKNEMNTGSILTPTFAPNINPASNLEASLNPASNFATNLEANLNPASNFATNLEANLNPASNFATNLEANLNPAGNFATNLEANLNPVGNCATNLEANLNRVNNNVPNLVPNLNHVSNFTLNVNPSSNFAQNPNPVSNCGSNITPNPNPVGNTSPKPEVILQKSSVAIKHYVGPKSKRKKLLDETGPVKTDCIIPNNLEETSPLVNCETKSQSAQIEDKEVQTRLVNLNSNLERSLLKKAPMKNEAPAVLEDKSIQTRTIGIGTQKSKTNKKSKYSRGFQWDDDFQGNMKALEKDIKNMSAELLRKQKAKEKAENVRKRENVSSIEQTNGETSANSILEWQRQKTANLKYFNFKPVTDTVKEVDNIKKKKKKEEINKKKITDNEIIVKHLEKSNEIQFKINIYRRETNTKGDNKSVYCGSSNNSGNDGVHIVNIPSEGENADASLATNINSPKSGSVVKLLQSIKSTEVDNVVDKHIENKDNEDKAKISPQTSNKRKNVKKIVYLNNHTNEVIDLENHTSDVICQNVATDVDKNNDVTNCRNNNGLQEYSQINVIDLCDSDSDVTGAPFEPDLVETKDRDKRDVLNTMSKVAAKIQENNSTAPINNSTVYYVVKTIDKNAKTSETRTKDPELTIAESSTSKFYVLKFPNVNNGEVTSIIAPLSKPGSLNVPTIKSISSLSHSQKDNGIPEVPDAVKGPDFIANSIESIPVTINNEPSEVTSVK